MAINRAKTEFRTKSFDLLKENYGATENCIFISHKAEDKDKAIEIGEYIRRHADIDIYLDIYDSRLQVATEREDHNSIVNHIEKGISSSTHVLCLISDKTRFSWWVPYEIGYAKKSNKKIASLKLKGIDDIPSFLKIEKTIMGTKSLNQYLNSLGTLYFSESVSSSLPVHDKTHPLDEILDWKL